LNVLVTGNTGYIGPTLGKELKKEFKDIILKGYDTGFFAHCLTGVDTSPDINYDVQFFGDIRNVNEEIFSDIDIVIHLAAISNDPMGNNFSEVTKEINSTASRKIAEISKKMGVKKFIFASSCSMYGSADSKPKKETDKLNPLTAYAKSKVFMEQTLEEISDENFQCTCLRYSTACGMTSRLRLDLVLNDFVASAISTKKIEILSDGSPWRPLIDVKDMVRAIKWAMIRNNDEGGSFLAVNVGKNEWNYQVIDLANRVAETLSGVEININPNAMPDKRSYKVDFSLYESLAPNHLPQVDLKQSIEELAYGLKKMNFADQNFRFSELMRLKVLQNLQEKKILSQDLYWA